LFLLNRHMTRWLLIVTCFLLGLVLISTPYVGMAFPAPATSTQSEELDKGRAILGKTCAQCHRVDHVNMQRKTEEGWRDTVYSMISRGAQVMPDEIEPLTAYLTANFGPDSPFPAARVNSSAGNTSLPNEAGKSILERSCVGCHALELVTSARKSEAEWRETIDRMLTFGANLTSEEQRIVTEYATQHLGAE
jgi:mono/diheme cytochrome c family protein